MSESDKAKLQLIKAYIRQRPFTKDEIELKLPSIINKITANEIVVKSGSTEKTYKFDRVFGHEASQSEIYSVVVEPMIDYTISGYNCTVFAYGQTGTGKTHTMIGAEVIGPMTDFNDDRFIGIIPRAAAQLFTHVKNLNKVEYTVSISFIEIYNEEVRDLLTKEGPSLKVYDDPDNRGSICVKGLTEVTVCDVDEVYDWLHIGIMERQTAATNLNRHSSRSHTIFTLQVRTQEITAEGEELLKTGKLHLIDLAGSENIGRSGATEMRAREAGTINKSLLTLGKVIKALAQKVQHIPYRDSKLTRILQDSLGGNTKTCMIATFSPCFNALDETISTLDYAHVARRVANCPQVNVNRKQGKLIRNLKDDIINLRQELDAARNGDGFFISQNSYDKMKEDIERNKNRELLLFKEIQNSAEWRMIQEQRYEERKESFLKTKAYLERMRKELEEQTVKDKENQFIINYMNDRDRELNTAANILLNVCKKSENRQDVYHSKYKSQCNSTVENANITKTISSSAVVDFREIKKSGEKWVKEQETYLRTLNESLTCLKNHQYNNLEELILLLSELEKKFTTMYLNYETLVKKDDADYSESTVFNLSTVFKQNNQLPLGHEEIKNEAEYLKELIETKNEKLATLSALCLDNMIRNCESKIEYLRTAEINLKQLNTNISNSIDRFLEELHQTEEFKATLQKQLLFHETQEQKLLEEYSSEKLTDQIHNFHQNYAERKPLAKVQEVLEEYEKCYSEIQNNHMSVIETIIDKMEKNSTKCQQHIVEDKSKTQNYISGFVDTIKNNLTHYNKELEDLFFKASNQMNLINHKLSSSVEESSGHVLRTLEQISDSSQTHNSDVKHFVRQSANNIQSLEKKVIRITHAGDTPMKETYTYPKQIVEKIPHEALIEKFKISNGNDF